MGSPIDSSQRLPNPPLELGKQEVSNGSAESRGEVRWPQMEGDRPKK